MSQSHNLDINTYSLEEIMGLLDLNFNLTEESMAKAKKKVLMTHPDKSKLPPDYFLFYKQAYEIVLNIYKQKVRSTQTSTVYNPNNIITHTLGTNSQVQLNETHTKKVSNDKFNTIFENNVAKKVDPSKYEWFKNEQEVIEFSGKNINPKNMGSELDAYKKRQSALIVHRGVQELRSSHSGTSYFDDDDNDGEYVASDIFGKLKFDDLRKVHKDQPVIAVSESDFASMRQYKSVDQFIRDRDQGAGTSMTKMEAENVLERQRKEKEQLIMQKQHREYMLQKEYEQKMNAVRSAFLQLK